MYTTIIIFLISFSGLLCGRLLAHIAKEELPAGRRYFHRLQTTLLLLLVVILLYPALFNPLTIIGFLIGIVLGRYFRHRYFYLGLALTLSFMLPSPLLLLTASVIFLYGLPYGTLLKAATPEHIITLFMFFIAPLLLLFMKETLLPSLDIYLSVTAGALFLRT